MSGAAQPPRVVARFGRYRLARDRSGWDFSDGCTGTAAARSPWQAWRRWRRIVREQRRASLAWHTRKPSTADETLKQLRDEAER